MARQPSKSAPAGGTPAKSAPAGGKPAKSEIEQADLARSGAAAEERRLLHEAAWSRMFGKVSGQNPFAR